MTTAPAAPVVGLRPLSTREVVDDYLLDLKGSRADAHYRTARSHLKRLIDFSPELPTTRQEINQLMASARRFCWACDEEQTNKPRTRHPHDHRPLTDRSRAGLHTYLRAFYSWANDKYGAPLATDGTRAPRPERIVRRIFSLVEMWRLIDYPHPNPRDVALCLLVADIGPRLGELAGLTKAHVTPTSVILSRHGKTGEHEAPIDSETYRALMKLPDGPSLWLCADGPRYGDQLSKAGIQQALIRCMRRAGLKGAPHKLRHSFARHFLRNGGSVTDLQRMLGHASTKTTEIYAREEIEDLKVSHARHSVVARRRLRVVTPNHHQAALEFDIG